MASKKYLINTLSPAMFVRQEQYAQRVSARYDTAVNSLIALAKQVADEYGDKRFSFDENPRLRKECQKTIQRLYTEVYREIKTGCEAEWEYANLSCDMLVNSAFRYKQSEKHLFARYFERNRQALDNFLERASGKDGLRLSQKVWKYTGDLKTELENAITCAIGEGKSASSLAKEVKQFLQYPDKLFRRVRGSDGKLHLSANAKAFHPSRGVYRSSYKNAMRLARTETNASYRLADEDRWQRMDFVVGLEVKKSNNHPTDDICDVLCGKYPKDFQFSAFHPQCRCYVVPILATPEELAKMNQNILAGNEVENYDFHSVNEVTEMPKCFMDWTEQNKERLLVSKYRPFFVQDNMKYMTHIFTSKEDLLLAQKDAEKKKIVRMIPEKKTYNASKILDKARKLVSGMDSKALSKRMQALEEGLANNVSYEKMEKLYARVVSGAITQNKWDDIVWKGYTAEQRANLEEFGRTIGIKKGRPMSHDLADHTSSNPLFLPDGRRFHKAFDVQYFINCQTCAPVYALRRHGFNIQALGNKPSSTNKYGEVWGKIGTWVNVWKHPNGQSFTYLDLQRAKTTSKMVDWLDKQPDGVFQIACTWKGGKSAHTFVYVRENGVGHFYDSQTNRWFKNLKDFREYSDDVSPTYGWQFFRVDNLHVNTDVMYKIVKPTTQTYAEARKERIEYLKQARIKSRPDNYREGLVERRKLTQEVDALLKKAEGYRDNKAINDAYDALKYARFTKSTYKYMEHLQDYKKQLEDELFSKERAIKTAQNVSKVARKFTYNADIKKRLEQLEAGVNAGNMSVADMQERTRLLAKMVSGEQKDNRLLSRLIPDVETWKQKFTSEELHVVYDKVEERMKQWSTLSLQDQKKKLHFEVYDYFGANLKNCQQKYKTWQVSQSAYLKQLTLVEEKIAWEAIDDAVMTISSTSDNFKPLWKKLADAEKTKNLAEAQNVIAELKQWDLMQKEISALPTSLKSKFAVQYTELDNALVALDITAVQSKLTELKQWESMAKLHADATAWMKTNKSQSKILQGLLDSLDAEMASGDYVKAQTEYQNTLNKFEAEKKKLEKREAKKRAGKNSITFGDECFTQERKDKAVWFNSASDANDYFWEEDSVEAWKNMTEDQKDALWRYTAGSSYLTEPLRAIDGHHYYYEGRPILKDIIEATDALKQTSFKHDAWIKRDDEAWCVEYVFGLKDLNAFRSDPSKLVGMTGIDRSFMSCSDAKESYFGCKSVVYNIYCPKGTQGIYAEPFSEYGRTKRKFTGVEKPTDVDAYNENEILLQRGTQMRITKAEWNPSKGKWYIDVEVTGQIQQEFELKKDSGYYCEFK